MKFSYTIAVAAMSLALLAGCNSSDGGTSDGSLGSSPAITFNPDPADVSIMSAQMTVDCTVADTLKTTPIFIVDNNASCVTNSPGTFTGSGTLTILPQGKECNTSLAFNEQSPSGTTAAVLDVNVIVPDLSFTYEPKALILANTNDNGTLVKVKIKDANFVVPYKIYLESNDSNVGVSPGFFEITDARTHDFNMTLNNAVLNFEGKAVITFVSANGNYTVPDQNYSVTVAAVTSVTRTVTLTNNCPYTVYPAISGGGFGNGTNCPTGSSVSADGKSCFWNNPLLGSYALDTNQSTTLTIPIGEVTPDDHIWSGGIAARLKGADGNWTIADCSGDANGSLEPCSPETGFSSPSTIAEFTLLRSNNDTYDITIITGVTVPTSMKPSNYAANAGAPYTNGEAGAVTAVGSNPAATWALDPNDPNTTVSTVHFNLVDGNGTDYCDQDNPCGAGLVCGYTKNAITTYSANGVPNTADYKLSCGKRLAYLSADAVWKANPDLNTSSNTSAFNFYAVEDQTAAQYPNSNGFKLWEFYECNTATGGPDTPYSNGISDAMACGCTNWVGIANPTDPCKYFNAAWMNNVQRNITWAKKACPTCYTFPYDDKTSTFTAYNAVSAANAANATDYNITFCPGGKTLPDLPAYVRP